VVIARAMPTRSTWRLGAACGRIPGHNGAERISVEGDLVFEFGGFDLIAYSVKDGRERWRARLGVEKLETIPTPS